MSQIKVGIVLSYVSMILSNLISIFYTPIMLRLMGQQEYGLYNFAGSVVACLGLLNFGLNCSYVRFYVRYHAVEDSEGVARLNGMFLRMYLGVSAVILLLGGWFAIDSNLIFGSELSSAELNQTRIIFIIMVINLVIALPVSVFGAYVVVHERFVFQKLVEVIRVVASPLIILPVLFMGYGAIGLVCVSTGLNIVICLTNIIFCLKKLDMKFRFKDFDFALLKEIFLFLHLFFLQ